MTRYHRGNDLIDIIRLLADNGIDLNAKESYGGNSLHLISRHYEGENFIDIVRLLIDKGIDVNATESKDNRNALHFVSEFYSGDNLIEIVRLLIDRGIDVNAKDRFNSTALHLLCAPAANVNNKFQQSITKHFDWMLQVM